MTATARTVYQTSPTKKRRRSKAEMQDIRDAIYAALEVDHPMTVRQVFYRLVSDGVIEKTESEYKNTVCRLLGLMRRSGDVPFGWISDSTRWMRKPQSFTSLESALRDTAETYRRSLWYDSLHYVEVWLEKEALAGVLYQETAQWDINLAVTRGYPSITYLYDAADEIKAKGKPAFLYYFGDYDPSGVDIARTVEEGIRGFAGGIDLHFVRVAVTPEQIEAWSLPQRPTKKTDSRAKGFKGESVEVDAIPPATLRSITRECIEQHIDLDELEQMQHIEEIERDILHDLAERGIG